MRIRRGFPLGDVIDPGGFAATWPLWLGGMLLAGPTLYDVATRVWSSEQGSFGIFVLAIGLWLLARAWPGVRRAATPGRAAIGWPILLAALAVHLLARIMANVSVEAASLYAAAVAALYLRVGRAGLRQAGFAIPYLALALPVPPAWIALATGQLRLDITEAAVLLLGRAGLMVAVEGLTIYIDQYRIAVAEACSGINSIVSLSALSLFYIHARRRRFGWVSLPLLLVVVVGSAIAGNFARVIAIVLMTHDFGEAVAQGPLHETVGFVTFAVVLGCVMIVDALLLGRVMRARGGA